MVKLELSAIFYSNGNTELAYAVKKASWEIGASVVNVSDVSDLVNKLHDIDIGILFIDCLTIKVSDTLIQLIKNFKGGNPSSVVFITEDEESLSSVIGTFEENQAFICKNDQLGNMLKLYEPRIKFNLEKNLTKKMDTKLIGTYLTNYLISLGFMPKHIGFTFIKQAIEIAVLNKGFLGSLSRDIYPNIASKNRTLTQNVERNIRNAIECAYKVNKFQNDSLHLMVVNGKISNRAFLSYLLDKVLNNYSESMFSKLQEN